MMVGNCGPDRVTLHRQGSRWIPAPIARRQDLGTVEMVSISAAMIAIATAATTRTGFFREIARLDGAAGLVPLLLLAAGLIRLAHRRVELSDRVHQR